MSGYFSRDMERLNYLLSEIHEVYHDVSVRLGVSDSAMDILYTLCIAGDRCPLRDIARLSGSSRQTIHSAVRGLERDGIIRLDACRTLTEATAQRVIAMENEIFDSWEEKEREQYLHFLQKYLTDLRTKIKDL